jgi:hypothetical protein
MYSYATTKSAIVTFDNIIHITRTLIFPFPKRPDGTLKQDVVILLHVLSPLKPPDQMCTLRTPTRVWTNGVSTYYLELNSKRIQKLSPENFGHGVSWLLTSSDSTNQGRLSLFRLVSSGRQNMMMGPVSSSLAIRPTPTIWVKNALREFWDNYSLHLPILNDGWSW